MPITSLCISNFRNLSAVELNPCDQGLNIISGNNGSGKTSILEAIYYLSLGRSFRTSTASRLIKQTTEKFSIFSQLVNESKLEIPLGVERDIRGSTRSRIAEKEVASIAELAMCLPVRMINSQSHNIFEAGPAFRRKYLDWGLFYHTDTFLPCWRQFERVLKQRNTVLKENRPKRELDVWTTELVKYGLELDKYRQDYVQLLAPIISEMTQELLDIGNVKISYQSGWDTNIDYATDLANHYADEIRFKHTQLGPHRADIDIKINDISVKHFLSRGQQKLLICAMILAQGLLLATHANKGLIYLVDDLPSELDLQSKNKLISLLLKQNSQVFITAIESEDICDFICDKSQIPMKVFHVEHGILRRNREQ